jgi:hypothetical protein
MGKSSCRQTEIEDGTRIARSLQLVAVLFGDGSAFVDLKSPQGDPNAESVVGR